MGTKKQTTLDGYIRVSRVGGREGESYISPTVQREAIQKWADYQGAKIAEWHVDEDESGGTQQRPGLTAAIERAVNGETGGIVAWKIDRFSRTTEGGLKDLRRLEDAGARLAFVVEQIDTASPMGKFVYTLMLAIGALFLAQIKAGLATAQERAVARGAKIGKTPVGYVKNGNGTLKPDPVFAPAITELFARAASKDPRVPSGDTALARFMNEAAPHPDGRSWWPNEIRRWLGNRVYLGEVEYGEHVNTDAHDPLTDAETFRKAQRRPGVKHVNADPDHPFALAGLVRCSHCRYSMTGASRGGSKRNDPAKSQRTRVYRCPRQCGAGSVIVADRLEAHVAALLTERLDREEDPGEADDPQKLTDAEATLEAAETELAEFVGDLALRSALGAEAYEAAKSQRVAAVEATRSARDAIEARVNVYGGGFDSVRWVFVRRRPNPAKVADRVKVVFADDPATIDVPRKGHSATFEPFRW